VDWTIYGALILGVLAVTVGAVRLFVRMREMWRSLKRLRRNLAGELERLATVAEATSAAAERAGDQERLNESLGRLRVSIAQLAVLRAAFDEATDAFGRFTAVVPRK
jgi:hypothetical protein